MRSSFGEISAALFEPVARPDQGQRNSIAFWDNPCVQHNAVSDYHRTRRVVHRVTIEGERPV